jgi:hypothetical protein
MTDEHGFPFQSEWEQRQSEPLPETKKPKKRLPIGIDEIPPLHTKENASATPSENHLSSLARLTATKMPEQYKTAHKIKKLF